MKIEQKIKDAILNNNLVIFAGSGLSSKFNLPSWNMLVEDIIKKLDTEKYNVFLPVLKMGAMQPIEVLEKIKSEHTLIKHYIKDNFNIINGGFDTHKKIIELTGQIITTNYDKTKEGGYC